MLCRLRRICKKGVDLTTGSQFTVIVILSYFLSQLLTPVNGKQIDTSFTTGLKDISVLWVFPSTKFQDTFPGILFFGQTFIIRHYVFFKISLGKRGPSGTVNFNKPASVEHFAFLRFLQFLMKKSKLSGTGLLDKTWINRRISK